MFAWYHPAAGGGAPAIGFVLCPPFGYEWMCVHRTYRKLAERLSQAGHPVLRLDLPGTANAEGSAEDPGLVEAWLAGLAAARDELQRRSGTGAVALFGLRLGATLAAQAAAVHGGFDALVLFAPLRSGGDFLREARAFRMLKGEKAPEGGGEEVAGYSLSRESCAALKAIDLGKLTRAPAPAVLLLGRDDLEEPALLGEHLRSLGCAVEAQRPPGYRAMMQDAYESEVPVLVLDAVLDWAGRLPRAQAVAPPSTACGSSRLALAEGAVEEVVRFGEGGRLFGLLAGPTTGPGAGRPAVVFLNTGANHQVGPNRMYVGFARALAARGVTALRFDLSGIGDSPAAPGGLDNDLYSARSLDDVRRALDFLAARGHPGAVLVGLCSGAYTAFHVAADERVRGLVLINQQTFHWKRGDSLAIVMRDSVKSSAYYRKAILDPATWGRLLRAEIHVRHLARALKLAVGRWLGRQGRALRSLLTNGTWEHSEVARQFRALTERGVRVLVLLGDQDGGIDVIEQHLGWGARRMRGRPEFELRVLAGPDHTFTQAWTQVLLGEVLVPHLERVTVPKS
jgi:pimeloyl-ACP methyl ester carboxylesterase